MSWLNSITAGNGERLKWKKKSVIYKPNTFMNVITA